MSDSCADHDHGQKKFDWLLWGSALAIVVGYSLAPLAMYSGSALGTYSLSVFELMNKMWIGLVLAIVFVGILNFIPRDFVLSVFGRDNGVKGILRATLAGLLLDLCSHGILLVGMKLYERGLSLGQVMAFLIASPWNSFSLTIVLVFLVGLKWTMVFILLSAVVAVISGLIFNHFVKSGTLPSNPHSVDPDPGFHFFKEARAGLKKFEFNFKFVKEVFRGGLAESKMILRWLFLGVVIASLMRAFISPENFQTYLGPTMMGLGLTALLATIVEVCSEGSTPIAAEILKSGKAPGNGFTFLMAGVSTDYTEIMSLKERTGHWKIALFLPLVTLPQIIFLGWLLNQGVI